MQAHPRFFSLFGLVISGVCWLAVVSARTPVWADEVYDWNIAGFDITVAGGQNPIVISRTMAMTHLAIHDALNAIDRRYEPYLLESVQKLYCRVSLRAMSLIMASRIRAREVLARFSRLRARRRQREIHASVRSTIQRLGRTWKPLPASERLTMSRVHVPVSRRSAATRSPW